MLGTFLSKSGFSTLSMRQMSNQISSQIQPNLPNLKVLQVATLQEQMTILPLLDPSCDMYTRNGKLGLMIQLAKTGFAEEKQRALLHLLLLNQEENLPVVTRRAVRQAVTMLNNERHFVGIDTNEFVKHGADITKVTTKNENCYIPDKKREMISKKEIKEDGTLPPLDWADYDAAGLGKGGYGDFQKVFSAE